MSLLKLASYLVLIVFLGSCILSVETETPKTKTTKTSKISSSSIATSSETASSFSSSLGSSSSSSTPVLSSVSDTWLPSWLPPYTIPLSDQALNPHGRLPDPVLQSYGSLEVHEMISAYDWELLFPNRAGVHYLCHKDQDFYTYESFLSATQAFPAFLQEGPDEMRLRELAAFLANISHETTGGSGSYDPGSSRYYWGLCWTDELRYASGDNLGYRSNHPIYPPAPGQSYHGRGPIQITWNYNYGLAGDEMELSILADPSLVSDDAAIAFKTAIWFWMKSQGLKPSAHHAILELWEPSEADLRRNRYPGFGVTINIINGGGECGIGSDTHPGPPDRLGYYHRFTEYLGVTKGSAVDCYSQRDFSFQ